MKFASVHGRLWGSDGRNLRAASPALALALEPRFMFDAAGAATGAEAARDVVAHEVARHIDHASDDSTDQALVQAVAAVTAGKSDGAESDLVAAAPEPPRKDVVFIDTSITGWQSLSAAAPAGAEVVLLDGTRDGLSQMAAWADGKQGYDAIHLLSHGGEGFVNVGTATLDTAAVPARTAELAALGAALSDTGDILLYGCAVGGGTTGTAFTAAVSAATGADVAASDDATGASGLGGDWTLETTTGEIETAALAADSYGRVLSDVVTGYMPADASEGFNNAAGNTPIAYSQSFTATKTGEIASISFGALAIHGDVTVRIRAGDGVGGAVLYSKTLNSGNVTTTVINGIQYFTYSIDSTVNITAGARYTICYDGGIEGHRILPINPYSGGTLYEGQDPYSLDTAFRVVQRDAVLPQPVADLNGNDTGIDTSTTAIEGTEVVLAPQAEVRAGTGAAHPTSMVIEFTSRPDGTAESLSLGNAGNNAIGAANLSTAYDAHAGRLTISGAASYEVYQTILRDVRYASGSQDPSPGNRTLNVTVSDGTATSAAAVINLLVSPVNDAPSATGTGNSVTFTEGGADSSPLFNVSSLDAGEAAQAIKSVRITADNILDGGAEGLVLNGSFVGMTAGTHSVGGHSVTIAAIAPNRYTVSIEFDAALSPAAAIAFLNGITYRNTNTDSPSTITRTITLDRITDDGGTVNGGVDQATVAVTAAVAVLGVNDAPTVADGTTNPLPGTDEDTPSSAQLVGSLLQDAGYADVDSGAARGMAVVGHTGAGTWQYSTDGVAWTAIGTASVGNALLLSETMRIRYVPDGANGETATLLFKGWDHTVGTPGDRAAVTATGGTTAFSTGTAAASLAVTAVNDAPVLIPAGPSLGSISEDVASNGGHTVASLLGGTVIDVDTGAAAGIAITGTTGDNGSWQYSTDDGATWTAVGTTSTGSALLLRSSDLVRFLPGGIDGTTASLTYRAWDRTSGTAGGRADASVGGGSTAFSVGNDTATLTVTAVNDAPSLTHGATIALPATTEDTPAVTAVSALLTAAGHADPDAGAVSGIAVTGITGNGTWQFSSDGVTWTDVGMVSEGGALLLTASMQLRYVPDGANAETATVAFRAWDQTAGVAGSRSAVTTNGGSTAFSAGTATASLAVADANDAPVLTPAAPTLGTITEDDLGNGGQTVGSFLGASVSDADADASAGIAVTGLVSGTGTWQFSLDGGTTWADMGAVAEGSALLLRTADRIRFVPDGRDGTTGSLTYRAWDRTTGTAGSRADTSTAGGSSAFSTATDTASIVVTAVNDAPQATRPTLPDGAAVVGDAYRFDIPTGWFSDAEPGTLTLSARNLPPDLQLVNGALVGAFSRAGPVTVQIVATDAQGAEAVSDLTITVRPAPLPGAPPPPDLPAPGQDGPTASTGGTVTPASRRDGPGGVAGLRDAPPPDLPPITSPGASQSGGVDLTEGGLLRGSSPLDTSGTPVATGIGTWSSANGGGMGSAGLSGGFGSGGLGGGGGLGGFGSGGSGGVGGLGGSGSGLEDLTRQGGDAPAFTDSLAAMHGTFDMQARQLAEAIAALDATPTPRLPA